MTYTGRLQIRQTTYRGRTGFTLFGDRVRIFDTDRNVVESIRRAYRELDEEPRQKRVDDLLSRKVKAESAAFETGAQACRDHDRRGRPHPMNPHQVPTDPNVWGGWYTEWHEWNRGWNSVGPNPARGNR